MFYQKMLVQSQRLEAEIKATKELLKTFPEGEFFSFKNGKFYKWFYRIGKDRRIVKKEELKFAEKMAKKKFYSYKLAVIENEKMAIDAYLKNYNTKLQSPDTLLDDNSNYKELLAPYFTSFSKEILDWMNAPYKRNPKYPEKLTHKTVNGLMVRSKSEAMIAKLLYLNKIPFRYECELTLGDKIVYPDFTIIHPKTGKIIYWEHFGLMDRVDYCAHSCTRYEDYVMNGYVPFVHLIFTYETLENPFSIEDAEMYIKKYFL